MIDRSLIGKRYPPFSIAISNRLIGEFRNVVSSVDPRLSVPHGRTPLAWPAILTLHGTACLIPIWEDLGVNPQSVWLVKEEFDFESHPPAEEELTGIVELSDLRERLDVRRGIEDEITLCVEFRLSSGKQAAKYTATYRSPLAKTVRPSSTEGPSLE